MDTVTNTAGEGSVRPAAAIIDHLKFPFDHPRLDHSGHLAAETLRNLARYFATKGHRPSPAMWEALTDLALTLEAMAEGRAASKFFLSCLDPGVGKTQTITRFTDTLLSRPDYEDVGVVICVGRLSEVATLVDAIAVPEDILSVLTSDATLNALGKAPVNAAQVLITTQQRIEKQLNNGAFNDASGFFYRGKPRAVRIWDESYLPGQTITLGADDLAFILRVLTPLSPELRETVKDIFNTVDGLSDGSVYEVPDFVSQHDVDLNDVLGMIDGDRDNGERSLRDDQRAILSSLWFLAGKIVTVRRDGRMGNAVIDYRDTLPEDLAPMVILDASGRVRETYRDIEHSRRTLVRLKTAAKRYDNLTVHLWQTGGGKQSFQKSGGKLIAGIVKAIDTKPTERWLVVVHRRDVKVGNVEQDLRSLIKAPQQNVEFITWGQHMATNDYVDVKNVILAGTLFYRPSFYEALKRLAAGRPANKGNVTREELERVMLGEHAHAILQALCRGAVRRCDGEHCHPCDAYIIASVKSGIPAALPSIFPGCTVVRWQPLERSLKGHVKAAVELVEQWFKSAKPGDVLPFKQLSKELGITSHDFKHSVRRHPDFISAVSELGIVEWGKGIYFTGFTVIS
jgi:hypothetical protein